MSAMSHATAIILTSCLALSACGTAAPGKTTEPGKMTQKAVQTIDRICTLPPAERDAQLRKLEAERGVVLVCDR